jgi:hypothetical protein
MMAVATKKLFGRQTGDGKKERRSKLRLIFRFFDILRCCEGKKP